MPTARLMAFRFVATTSWPPPSARHGHVARSPRPTSRTTTLRPCATFSATTWVLQTQRSGDSFGPDQELTSFSSQLNEVSRTRFCWCVCVCVSVRVCPSFGAHMCTPRGFDVHTSFLHCFEEPQPKVMRCSAGVARQKAKGRPNRQCSLFLAWLLILTHWVFLDLGVCRILFSLRFHTF